MLGKNDIQFLFALLLLKSLPWIQICIQIRIHNTLHLDLDTDPHEMDADPKPCESTPCKAGGSEFKTA